MKQLKKILSVLLVLAMIVAYVPSVAVGAESQTGATSEPTTVSAVEGGAADFNTISSNGSTSYGSHTTTGGWKIANSSILVGGNKDSSPVFKIVGSDSTHKAVCLNGKTSAPGSLISPTLTTGISKLSIKYTMPFSDTKLSVKVTIKDANGQTYATHDFTRTGLSSTTDKLKLFEDEWVLETPFVGNFTIEVVNNCPSKSTSNKDRFAILSLSWEGASSSGESGGETPDPEMFDITFDLNGAEGAIPVTRQVAEGAAYGVLPEVSRKGYTFGGWFKTADCSGEAVTAEDIVSEEHTLYAKWTAKPVANVSFDMNYEGATDAPEAITVVIGDAYETLPMASREGYVFGGWYTDSDCTGSAVVATDTVEESHTLYAKWIKGNTIQIAISFSDTTQRISYSTSKHVWGNGGLSFTNDKADSSTNIADYPSANYAHIRLYKDSKVTIACEGMTKMAIVSESGSDYKTAFTNSLISAGLNYTLSGDTYTILFSELTDSVTIPMSGGQARLKSITVTALAPAPEVFDVSFDLNGAEGTAPETVQVEEGKAYGELPEVSREGYTFDGWYKTADCSGEAVTAEDTVSEEHILYAKWTYIPTEDSSDIVENWGLTLKDEVVVKFNMTFTPETLADAGAYVEVKVDDEITKIAVADVAGPLEIPVSAAQMTDEITLCVVKGNENRGEEMAFTVRQYCETILADEKYAAYHPLVKEMLNYGGHAQAYFGYNTEDLANEGLKDVGVLDVPADAAPEKIVSGEIEGISFYGASLLLRDKVTLRFYFTVTGDIAEYTFKVNGKEVNWNQKNGMYYIDAKDIVSQALGESVTVTVNDSLTITYSPMNYIVGMSNNSTPGLSALVKALYNYHLAAKAFMAQG